jgi:chromosome segregation ATPase
VQLALASERSAEADEAESAAGRRRIESEVARLTSESQRLAGLAESGAVTQRLAEEALQKLAAAESSLEELAAAVQSAAARRGEARAASVRAEADLKAMEARRGKCGRRMCSVCRRCAVICRFVFRFPEPWLLERWIPVIWLRQETGLARCSGL